MHRKIVVLGLMAGLGAAAAPATAAEKVIEAQTTWHFDAMTYTIDQGDSLVFHNRDTASPGPHNVTAADSGSDGKPLFASKTINNGEDAPVVGAEQLKTGSYEFMCTIHTFMTATLNVTDQGTPQPAPAPAPDTTAPTVRAAIKAAKLQAKVFTASVTSDEAAGLTARLVARVSGHTFTVGTASASASQAGHAVTLKIRASKSARTKLAHAKRAALTLTVKARDAAGNASTATAHRTIKRSS